MKIFKWENGQIRLAVFSSVILSAALSYVLFVKKGKPVEPEDLRPIIEIQLLALENDEIVFRAWKQSAPGINVDTTKIFGIFKKRRQQIDSILLAKEEK